MVPPESEERFETIPIGSSSSENPASSAGGAEFPGRRRRRRPPRRGRLAAVIVTACAGLYLLAGFVLVPYLWRSSLPARLSADLARPVTVGDADFNPFTLTLTLYNGIVGPRRPAEAGDVDPLFSFRRVEINFAAVSLIRGTVVCQRLEIDRPFLHFVRDIKGRYNLERILGGAGGDRPRLTAIPYSLRNIEISGGKLLFDDRPAGAQHLLDEINLQLPDFSSPAEGEAAPLRPRFSALVNGSPVSLAGRTGISGAGTDTSLHLEFHDLNLPDYLAYLPGGSGLTVTRGTADLLLDLDMAAEKGKQAGFRIRSRGRVVDVWLRDRQGREVVKIPVWKLTGEFFPLEGRFLISESILEQAEFTLDRSPGGRLEMPGLKTLLTAMAKGGHFGIERLRVEDGRCSFTDRFIDGGFLEVWEQVDLVVEKLEVGRSGKQAKPARLTGSAVGPAGAVLTVNAEVDPVAWRVAGFLSLEDYGLSRLQPYLDAVTGRAVRIREGIADMEGRCSIGGGEGPVCSGATVQLRDTLLALDDRQWLRAPSMTFRQVDVDSGRRTVNLGSVVIAGAGLELRYVVGRGLETRKIFGAPFREERWRIELDGLDYREGTVRVMVLEEPAAGGEEPPEISPLTLFFHPVAVGIGPAGDPNIHSIRGAARLAGGGGIEISGRLAVEPVEVDLEVAVKGLELRSFNYPLSAVIDGQVAAGILDGEGIYHWPENSFSGAVEISGLTAARAGGGVLWRWRSARVGDVHFDGRAGKLRLAEAVMEKPVFNWTIPADGAPDPFGLFRPPSSAVRGSSDTVLIDIQDLRLIDGEAQVIDRRLTPAHTTQLTDVAGRVDYSFAKSGDRTGFALRGLTGGRFPFTVNGKAATGGYGPLLHFRLQSAGLPLPELAPYLEPVLGWKIGGGRLDLVVEYSREDDRLSILNRLRLDGFRLGARIGGDEHLPLAVALLTDNHGRILLDVPLVRNGASGDFSLPAALEKELRRLLAKTAAAPFSLLAEMLPDEVPPADRLVFPYGESTLTEKGRRALAALALVLQGRPLLGMTITGLADPGGDRGAIAARRRNVLGRLHSASAGAEAAAVASFYGGEEIDFPREKIAAGQKEPGMSAGLRVTEAELRKLAERRSRTVFDYLVRVEGIEPSRLRYEEPRLAAAGRGTEQSGNLVELRLHSLGT